MQVIEICMACLVLQQKKWHVQYLSKVSYKSVSREETLVSREETLISRSRKGMEYS